MEEGEDGAEDEEFCGVGEPLVLAVGGSVRRWGGEDPPPSATAVGGSTLPAPGGEEGLCAAADVPPALSPSRQPECPLLSLSHHPPEPTSQGAVLSVTAESPEGGAADRQPLGASPTEVSSDWLATVRRALEPGAGAAAAPEVALRDTADPACQSWPHLPPAEAAETTLSSSSGNSSRRSASSASSSAVRLRPPRASLGASSHATMGILQMSDLEGWTDWADTSLSSYEGVGQQPSPVDVPALESHIAQLEHSLRALQEECSAQQLQLQQQDEANVQLTAALKKLTDENNSLTSELERIVLLRGECDRLQQALDAELAERDACAERGAHSDRLIAAQQTEIDQLSLKLGAADVESRSAADRQRHLQRALSEAHREAALLRSELQDREDRQDAAQRTIDALHNTVREMRDAALALQEEKSRYSSELSSVRQQLLALRRTPRSSAAAAADSGAGSQQRSPTPNGDSIHDEIISTIKKTGDGDPVLPISGIATPELVRAIHASPLNLHCSRLSQRLLKRAPSLERRSFSPDVSVDLTEPPEESFSSAASDSYRSAAMSARPERVDQGTDCPPGPTTANQYTETESPLLESPIEQRCPAAPGSAAKEGRSTEHQSEVASDSEAGPESLPERTAETSDWSRALQREEAREAPSPDRGELESCLVELCRRAEEWRDVSEGELPAGSEAEDSTRLLWLLNRLAEGLCSEPACSDTFGTEQNNNTAKPEWSVLGPRSPLSLQDAAALLLRLPAAILPGNGDGTALLDRIMAQLRTQESVMESPEGFSAPLNKLRLKRTTSDGALGAQQRTRFCSMPTVEEDPDTEMPQHAPLRPSFSLPCEQSDVGVFPSLTEHLLADLDSFADENANNPNEKDLESKFCSLALAFKTDRLTLHERLDVQRRHRDQAEHNLELEAQRFRDQLMHLNAPDADRSEQQKTLQRQLDIVKQISQRLSRKAEMLGAAQQELRVSRAVEVMTQHVEALRHLYEREHAELEEARRVLATNNIALHEPAKASPAGRRRASIAVFSRSVSASSSTSALSSGSVSSPGTPPSPCVAASSTPLLRRRRNSLGAGDGDGFGAITEEKEEEAETSESAPHAADAEPPPAEGELQLESAEDGEPDELRSEVEETVTDELSALRSDQEQLANDIKTLLSRQRDAVLQQTSGLGKLVWDVVNAWPYSREQTMVRARYCFGGLFLLLAVMVLLVPPAYSSCNPSSRAWYSWAELLAPLLSVEHVRPPPL